MTRYLPLFFLALVPFGQRQIDHVRSPFAVEQMVYIRSGPALKRLWSGLTGVAADIYWLRTVQYYGGQRAFTSGKRYDLLLPLLDITVTLDPRFDIAYKYGSIFLAELPPMGAGDVKAGIALLERGSAANPSSWRMRQHLAYCTYLYLHDTARAARILQDAANMPGAPYWLRTMAAQLVMKGGDRQMARTMWEEIDRSAEKGPMKEVARFNLMRFDAADQAERLQKLVEGLAKRTGARPQSLEDLRRAGLPASALLDPSGKAFDYDPATGRVRISHGSMLWSPDAR